jgi:hypothetical protein
VGSNNQKKKKKQRKRWLWYQLSVILIGIALIVAYVYTPSGGWGSLWYTTLHQMRTIVLDSSTWLSRLQRNKFEPVQGKIASYTDLVSYERPSYTIRAQLETSTHTIHGQADVWIPKLNTTHVTFYLYTEQNDPIRVTQVTWNNQPLKFVATNQILDVRLPKQENQATLHVTFDTPVLQGGYRYGEKDNVWTIGYWYPILGVRNTDGSWLIPPLSQGYGDPFLMDNADYDVTFTAPASFTWFTTGPNLTSKTSNGSTTTEWKVDDVRNFAMVGSPRFIDHTLQLQSGTIVHIATLQETHYQQLQNITQQAIDTYQDRIGSFYYPQLSVIEMPSGTVFAHEYPGLALFSSDIWNWSSGEHWIAHEIAHGWWYDTVGDYKAETAWLDEGLAEYSSLLYVEHRYGKKAYDEKVQQLLQLWKTQESYLPNSSGFPIAVGSVTVDQPYSHFQNKAEYYYATYLRPTLMYAELRNKMGDSKFFEWLQQYYLKNSGKVATRNDLTQALQDVDASYVPLLNHWLDTPNQTLIQQESKH